MQKWLTKCDSVKRFSMQTGVLIGTGNAFLHQRFIFARQLQHYCRDYWKFVRVVTCAVMFVATEMLKNALKLQGSCLCKHWWTYPTCVSTNFRPTSHKLQANFAQTSGQLRTNFRPTLHKLQANFSRTSGQLHTNFRSTSHKLQANFAQTSGQLSTNFMLTSHKLQANFARTSAQLSMNFSPT